MPKFRVAAYAAATLAFACQPALAGEMPPATGPHMTQAEVVGLDGKVLGTVSLQDTPTGVLVATDLKGLPPGEHGFHVHEKGACDPATKFASAGGHFAGGHVIHGLMMEGGPHGGDMPNQHVGPDGVLETQILNTGVTLASGLTSLDDADGSALVIHAAADDYTSQPSGNAGARIACAVIYPPES